MLANRLAKYAALRGIYYGWVMAGPSGGKWDLRCLAGFLLRTN